MTGTTGIPQRDAAKTVLVTGATGYIGGRLVPRLLEAGHTVKVLVRTPAKIAGVPWLDEVEVVQSSLDDGGALRTALAGVDVLYFLVHSMAAGAGFEAKEKAMAETPRRRPPRQGSAASSTWAACTPPMWVRNRIEAIAVRDVLYYLVAAASLQGPINRTFDIGCRQVLSYAGMMKEYAAEAGLPHRVVLALPIPAPKLAGMWVALTTPIPLSMSLPLVQSLQHDAVSREHDVDSFIPVAEAGLTPYRRAVALALGKERDGQVETTWPMPAPMPIRCPAIRTGPGTRSLWTNGRSMGTSILPACGPSRASAAGTAGTLCRSRGRCGAGWTSSPAARVSCGGAGTGNVPFSSRRA